MACGIKRLKDAPGWKIHLATGDSLLFGSRPTFRGGREPIKQQGNLFQIPSHYGIEEPEEVRSVFDKATTLSSGTRPTSP